MLSRGLNDACVNLLFSVLKYHKYTQLCLKHELNRIEHLLSLLIFECATRKLQEVTFHTAKFCARCRERQNRIFKKALLHENGYGNLVSVFESVCAESHAENRSYRRQYWSRLEEKRAQSREQSGAATAKVEGTSEMADIRLIEWCYPSFLLVSLLSFCFAYAFFALS